MGSNISWQKLLKHLRASKCVSCAMVLSLLHQDENVAFQIPRVSVKKELDEAVPFKNSLKSNRMFSNSVGLGEQHQYIFYNFARDFAIDTFTSVDSFTALMPRDPLW